MSQHTGTAATSKMSFAPTRSTAEISAAAAPEQQVVRHDPYAATVLIVDSDADDSDRSPPSNLAQNERAATGGGGGAVFVAAAAVPYFHAEDHYNTPPPTRAVRSLIRCHVSDNAMWAKIYNQSPFFETVGDRRAFKDWKRNLAEANPCDPTKNMVAINIGGVSYDIKWAKFAAGCLGLYCAIPIYDVLPKGQGTIRFHVWASDVYRLEPFSKRIGMNPEKWALEEGKRHITPELHMQTTCQGEVFFSTSLQEISQCHRRCHVQSGCPRRTCDVSYAFSGNDRIDLREAKRREEEDQARQSAIASWAGGFYADQTSVYDARHPEAQEGSSPAVSTVAAGPKEGAILVTPPPPVDDDDKPEASFMPGMDIADKYDRATDSSVRHDN